ncbi:MAG: endolytic transglycosylase MltG [Myxococcota bacterium]|nr:endolytic transglycosylase MltG [Myxococcota bacterium]
MRLLVVLTIASAALAGAAYHWVEGQMAATGEVRPEPVMLTIAPGTSFRGALSQLHEAGLLADIELAYYWARLREKSSIRSGTYRFSGGESAAEVLGILNVGRVVTERLTIAEGLNRWQIRDLLVAQGWMDGPTFDRLCDDASLLEKYAIPAHSCEGFLFPETYTLARGLAPAKIFSLLLQTYRAYVDELLEAGQGPLNLNELEFVTLASIVEKETGAAHERPRIACVFYNRLKAKPAWRLETDPTVIYAAILEDPNFDGNIKRYHLRKMENPYNTYRNFGLPPGPIASPGKAALAAVQAPSACEDFFFVSKNNGEHIFCPTLSCHQKAVQTWQIDYFRKKR